MHPINHLCLLRQYMWKLYYAMFCMKFDLVIDSVYMYICVYIVMMVISLSSISPNILKNINLIGPSNRHRKKTSYHTFWNCTFIWNNERKFTDIRSQTFFIAMNINLSTQCTIVGQKTSTWLAQRNSIWTIWISYYSISMSSLCDEHQSDYVDMYMLT